LSHALSQSVKISLACLHYLSISRRLTAVQFEELISSTIEETKDIPEVISETGKIGMPHKGSWSMWGIEGFSLSRPEIMQQIGQLFLLRTNINSVGSVLDSPVSYLFSVMAF
jgi:uncharacterized Rmd1/YagE family protein